MTSIRSTLRDADPLRREPIPGADRDRIRRAVLAAATDLRSRRARPATRRAITLGVLAIVCAVAVVALKARLGGGATLHAAVRFEVSVASRTRDAGMSAVKMAGTDAVLFVAQEPIVTNDDVQEAHVVPHADGSGFDIAVTFSRRGAQKMAAATRAHIGEPLAIVIDGEVVAAPVIRSTVSEQARITGQFTEADATRIANGITVR